MTLIDYLRNTKAGLTFSTEALPLSSMSVTPLQNTEPANTETAQFNETTVYAGYIRTFAIDRRTGHIVSTEVPKEYYPERFNAFMFKFSDVTDVILIVCKMGKEVSM